MRRLAKHSRNDRVRSKRDYQTIVDRQAASFELAPNVGGRLVFCARVTDIRSETPFVAVGGYVSTNTTALLRIELDLGRSDVFAGEIRSARRWTRFGFLARCSAPGDARVTLYVPAGVRKLDLWGLDCDALNLPNEILRGVGRDVEVLSSSHLAPETYYLSHADAVNIDLVEEEWNGIVRTGSPGTIIKLKKCAYCQRLLPIDPSRSSRLAFHKHNAKVSGHQNECRACKKWRINNTFNPRRTKDQLHESSVTSRERRLFLREPDILAAIKDRRGAGLKTIIWQRFGKACFRCDRQLALLDVELDHTRPMAYLWPIDEHATCLCATCNNFKRERFPVDVYDEKQLRRLSAVTGLSIAQLTAKTVNPVELARVLKDITSFTREWDARTFNATARKVKEIRPEIDLFSVLREADPRLYAQLLLRLKDRPD